MSALSVPFFDAARGDAAHEAELAGAFRRVVQSGRYILGPEVAELEAACADYLRVPHAVGVSSGTDALLATLMGLGIGPGDEVVVPAYTFFATAGAVSRVGATPVFADVARETLQIDPASAARAMTARTRALIAVHLFGDCAPMAELLSLATGRGIPVIEDAAQAFGSSIGGRRAGTLGEAGCFSFFPTKNLGGLGDGGLVVTRDADLAERVRVLRAQGARPKHHHAVVGGNFRLDALQAALLRCKLPRADALIARRRAHAELYDALLGGRGLPITLPPHGEGRTFNQYVIRMHDAAHRDALREYLAARGIGTEIYYPTPLHRQPCFAGMGRAAGSLPEAEAAARETLALPIFPALTEAEIERVAAEVASFFA